MKCIENIERNCQLHRQIIVKAVHL